jgi:DNA-binding beta-propeller fold protein YncE
MKMNAGVAGIVAVLAAMGCGDSGTVSRGSPKTPSDLATNKPVPRATLVLPTLGCVKSVGATHSLRRIASIATEGERDKPQPQDADWSPGAISDLAVRGNQYVMVDRGSARIYVTDSLFGNRREFGGSKGNGPGDLQSPEAVAFDPRGDTLWVLDNGRHVAAAYTTAGRFVRELRVPVRAIDLAIGSDGTLYVSRWVVVGEAAGTEPNSSWTPGRFRWSNSSAVRRAACPMHRV